MGRRLMTWLPRAALAALIALRLCRLHQSAGAYADADAAARRAGSAEPGHRAGVDRSPCPIRSSSPPLVTSTPAVPKPRDPQPASRPPEHPPATTTPPAPDPATQPVLQTTSNTDELAQRAKQHIDSAEQRSRATQAARAGRRREVVVRPGATVVEGRERRLEGQELHVRRPGRRGKPRADGQHAGERPSGEFRPHGQRFL